MTWTVLILITLKLDLERLQGGATTNPSICTEIKLSDHFLGARGLLSFQVMYKPIIEF